MATVAVYCSSSERIDRGYIELATEVGDELARRGHDLVSGGGSISCMGAVARAVRAGGRRTVGVIPKALIDLEVADHDADELVVAPDMRSRKAEMDRRADAFLTLPGGLGTLEELLEIWVAHTLAMHGKPVVALDPDGLYAPLRDQVQLMVDRGFVRVPARDTVSWTTTAGDALDAIDRLLAGPRAGRRVVPAAEDLLEAEP